MCLDNGPNKPVADKQKVYDPFIKSTMPAGVWRKPVVVERPDPKPTVPAPVADPFYPLYGFTSPSSDSSSLSSPSVDSYNSGGGGDFGGGGASGSWD